MSLLLTGQTVMIFRTLCSGAALARVLSAVAVIATSLHSINSWGQAAPAGCQLFTTPSGVVDVGARVTWFVRSCVGATVDVLIVRAGGDGWGQSELTGMLVPFPIGSSRQNFLLAVTPCAGQVCGETLSTTLLRGREPAPPVTPPPVARDDYATTTGATPVTVAILSNDEAPGSALDPTSVTLDENDATRELDAPEGRWGWDPSAGLLTFTARKGYVGNASVTYRLKNTAGGSASATVYVAVTRPTPPVARDVNLPTTVGMLRSTMAMPAGADLDSDTVAIDQVMATAAGVWRLEGTGNSNTLGFEAALGFVGTAELRFVVRDDYAQVSNVAFARVTVSPPAAPRAVDDTARGTADAGALDVWPLSNDQAGVTYAPIDPGSLRVEGWPVLADADSTRPTMAQLWERAEGRLECSDGRIRFKPAAAWSGTLVLRYSVADAIYGRSATATITFAVDLPPVEAIAPIVLRTASGRGGSWALARTPAQQSMRIDLDEGTAGVQSQRLLPVGGFVVNGTTLTLAAAPGASGDATLNTIWYDTYQRAIRVPVQVTVVADDLPLATNDAATVTAGETATLIATANDFQARTGPGLHELSVLLDSAESGWSVGADGRVRFLSTVPGVHRAFYTVEDAAGKRSNTGVITVTVRAGAPLSATAAMAAQLDGDTAVAVPGLHAAALAALAALIVAAALASRTLACGARG